MLLAPKTLILLAPVFFSQLFTFTQTHLTVSTVLDIIAKPALCLFIWGIYKSFPKKKNSKFLGNIETNEIKID